jgi:hypothetical protein
MRFKSFKSYQYFDVKNVVQNQNSFDRLERNYSYRI